MAVHFLFTTILNLHRLSGGRTNTYYGMKRVFLFLVCVFSCFTAFSQNVIRVGNDLATTDNMEKSKTILTSSGFVIEPIEELFGIDPDLRITASNGLNASTPILCTIEAMGKQDRRIFLIRFVCNKVNHSEIRNSLQNASYTLLESGSYKEHTFTIPYSRYKKGDIICRVSWLDTGVMVEFINSKNKPN